MADAWPILPPGIHDGIEFAHYLSTACTPAAAMQSSAAITIQAESPAHYWRQSPLNPDAPEDPPTRKMELGTTMHAALLEPKTWRERVMVIDATSWSTKNAQFQRDVARANDRIPLLKAEAEQMTQVVAAVQRNTVTRNAFLAGKAEQTIVWRDEATGIWCKARPDFLRNDRTMIVSVKTMERADPVSVQRTMQNDRWYQQAAWEIEGVRAATGIEVKSYWYVVQEQRAPFVADCCELDLYEIEAGMLENRVARETFARCLRGMAKLEADARKKGGPIDLGLAWHGYRRPERPDRDLAYKLRFAPWKAQQIEDMREQLEKARKAKPTPEFVGHGD